MHNPLCRKTNSISQFMRWTCRCKSDELFIQSMIVFVTRQTPYPNCCDEHVVARAMNYSYNRWFCLLQDKHISHLLWRTFRCNRDEHWVLATNYSYNRRLFLSQDKIHIPVAATKMLSQERQTFIICDELFIQLTIVFVATTTKYIYFKKYI
jgi:hypothetical protein